MLLIFTVTPNILCFVECQPVLSDEYQVEPPHEE